MYEKGVEFLSLAAAIAANTPRKDLQRVLAEASLEELRFETTPFTADETEVLVSAIKRGAVTVITANALPPVFIRVTYWGRSFKTPYGIWNKPSTARRAASPMLSEAEAIAAGIPMPDTAVGEDVDWRRVDLEDGRCVEV